MTFSRKQQSFNISAWNRRTWVNYPTLPTGFTDCRKHELCGKNSTNVTFHNEITPGYFCGFVY